MKIKGGKMAQEIRGKEVEDLSTISRTLKVKANSNKRTHLDLEREDCVLFVLFMAAFTCRFAAD